MNTPTHEEITRQAHRIWTDWGCPEGRDTEIWHEAERQLREGAPTADGRNSDAAIDRVKAEMAAESVAEYHISPAIPDQEAIKAAIQKQEARAPQVPHHTGPAVKPPVSGKPVWNKPHSS